MGWLIPKKYLRWHKPNVVRRTRESAGGIMKKRVVLAILAVLLLLIPGGYYVYFGLVRKEHFYHGLPTSYWSGRIAAWNKEIHRAPSSIPYFYCVCGCLFSNRRGGKRLWQRQWYNRASSFRFKRRLIVRQILARRSHF